MESSLYLDFSSGFEASECKIFCLIFNKHYVIFSSINNFYLCTFDIAFFLEIKPESINKMNLIIWEPIRFKNNTIKIRI